MQSPELPTRDRTRGPIFTASLALTLFQVERGRKLLSLAALTQQCFQQISLNVKWNAKEIQKFKAQKQFIIHGTGSEPGVANTAGTSGHCCLSALSLAVSPRLSSHTAGLPLLPIPHLLALGPPALQRRGLVRGFAQASFTTTRSGPSSDDILPAPPPSQRL